MFTLDLQKFAKKVGGKTETVIRRVAYDAFSRVIRKTPVDLGRARANWIPLVGKIPTGTIDTLDKSGDATIAKVAAESKNFKPGTIFYLVNNLPYINRLENGWSQQAPSGMVQTTMVEVRSILRAATRGKS